MNCLYGLVGYDVGLISCHMTILVTELQSRGLQFDPGWGHSLFVLAFAFALGIDIDWSRHKAMIYRNRKPLTKSWYMGDNVPGKFREQLNFAGGFPLYKELTQASLDRGFEGFVTA